MKRFGILSVALFMHFSGFAQYAVVGQINNTHQIQELSFPHKDTGWLCAYTTAGQGFVYRTVNGGASWQQQFQCNSKLNSIQFINTHVGFISGKDSSLAFRTNDGGVTWQRITPDSTLGCCGQQAHYEDIFFVDSLTGYIGGLWDLSKTTDGGLTWDFVHPLSWSNGVKITSIHFYDALNGAISGEPEHNYATQDGGQTWIPMIICTGGQGCTNEDIVVTAPDTLRAVGGLGRAYYGNDIGFNNFMFNFNMGTFQTEEISFINSQVGYAISFVSARVKRTDNGGVSWVDDYTGAPLNNNLNALTISDDKQALYIGTRAGQILKRLVVIAPPQPDLSIQSQLVSPTTVKAGGTFNDNYIIANNGSLATANFMVHFYLSYDNAFSPSTDVLLGTATLGPISAGSNTGGLSQSLAIPCTVTPGLKYIFIQADSSNSISESNENNNTSVSTITVTAFSAGPANTTICLGSSVTLTASGAHTYEWMGPAFHSTAGSVSVTPVSEGINTYTVTGTTGSCTNTRSLTITVHSVADLTILTNDTAVCAGNVVVLEATGATVYNWSPSTGLNTTTGNIVSAQPAQTTVYTVTGTQGNCTATKQVTVTVLANPVLTISPGDTSVCSGSSVTLKAEGAASYSWSPATALNTATGSVVIASPSSSVTYTVNGLAANGCLANKTATVSVIPSVQPSVSISYTGCPTSVLQFQATPTNGGSSPQISWYVNNILSGSGTSFSLANAVNGMQVYATVTSNAVCAAPVPVQSSVTTVNCITTALPRIDGLESFSIFPNPSKGRTYLKMKLNSTKKVEFRIIDQQGCIIYTSSARSWYGNQTMEIDIQDKAAGLYYVEINIGGIRFVEKLVIR